MGRPPAYPARLLRRSVLACKPLYVVIVDPARLAQRFSASHRPEQFTGLATTQRPEPVRPDKQSVMSTFVRSLLN